MAPVSVLRLQDNHTPQAHELDLLHDMAEQSKPPNSASWRTVFMRVPGSRNEKTWFPCKLWAKKGKWWHNLDFFPHSQEDLLSTTPLPWPKKLNPTLEDPWWLREAPVVFWMLPGRGGISPEDGETRCLPPWYFVMIFSTKSSQNSSNFRHLWRKYSFFSYIV